MKKHMLVGFALALVGFACGQAAVRFGEPTDYTPVDTTGDAGNNTGPIGLPCDVANLLQSQCQTCHSNPPLPSVPMPLVTRDDLVAMRGDKSVGQLSVERMNSTDPSLVMPQGNKLPAADIAVLENWVNAGMPEATCGSTDDTSPRPLDPNSPATCTSGSLWTRGDHESPDMHPGQACIQCHADRGEGPRPALKIAGTVYPSLHEPDDCNSGGPEDPSDATVEIIDKNGKSISFTPSSVSGNFSTFRRTVSFAFPIRAMVHYDGRTRQMAQSVTTGDCNSCHTQNGDENAPGRIVLP